jgi:DNA (cytosine-5)-methyltransferase 1
MKKVLIDLFCGIGGLSQGFKKNGFDVVLAADTWVNALVIHKHHNKQCKHFTEPLGTAKASKTIRDFVKLQCKKGDWVHVHASPPCQNLSTCNIDRNENVGLGLVEWSIELFFALENLHPRLSWSLEQVVNNQVKLIFDDFDIFYTIVSMSDYGVCQERKRFIACSDDLVFPPAKKPKTMDMLLEVPSTARFLGNGGAYATSDPTKSFYRHREKKIEAGVTVAYTVVSTPARYIDRNGKLIRRMTVEECAKLQTFPGYFLKPFYGKETKSNLYKLVANAVPPDFAYILCKAIEKCI